jgi:tetratricopeptide (TPR) repeat protein
LIRFLGGEASVLHPSPQGGLPQGFATPQQTPVPPAPPPHSDPTLLLQQAERYFVYAELLSQQGSGDLAGAVYRQAYVGLRAVFGVQGAPVVGLQQPVLPPSRTAPPAVQAPQGTELERRLQPLKERLSSATAPEVEQQLLHLLQQGHRHEDLTNLLGLAALMQDRREDAERWFRETLTLNPRHHRALVNLGGLFLSTSRPEEAVQVLSRAVELINPQAPEALAALTNLSLAYQQLGRQMDAAQLALRIFRSKPDHLRPESLAAVSQTLEEMGEDQAAIEMLQYLRSRGVGPDLIRRLAQLLERRGDFQEAAMVYRDLLSNPGAAATQP